MIKFEIKDSGPGRLRAIVKSLERFTQNSLYVGLPDAGKAAAQHDSGSNKTVVEIALINEYGTGDGHIPARPAIRSAMADEQNRLRLAQQLTHDTGAIFTSGLTADQIFARTGLLAVAMIQKSMTDWDTPPNAPATIARKGVNNPLIDEGIVRRAVTFVIRPT